MIRRLALLADVHANLEALDAVLADVDRRAPDALVVCAGDVVGYGPDPEACLERLAARDARLVCGDHDEMALGRRSEEGRERAAVVSTAWTRGALSDRARSALARLPVSLEVAPGVVACHGDPSSTTAEPGALPGAQRALAQAAGAFAGVRVLVVGHTRGALYYRAGAGRVEAVTAPTLLRLPDEPLLVSPGPVGRAREDGPPCARWALLDLELRRVSWFERRYDAAPTLRKMARAGLVPAVTAPPRGALVGAVDALRARWARARGAGRRPGAWLLHPGGPGADAPLRRRLLRVAQRAIHRLGVGALFRRLRPGGAVILMYHAIVDDEEARWVDLRYAVPAPVFEQQMRFLAGHRRVVALDTLLGRLARGEPVERGTVVITFDDGYRDLLHRAAPVLRRYDLPAVAYLPTHYISTGASPDVEVLTSALRHRTRHELDLRAFGLEPLVLADAAAAGRAHGVLDSLLTLLDFDARQRLLGEVREQLRPGASPPRLTLDWGEVRQLQRAHPGITLGVHTRHHMDLGACSAHVAEEQVRGSIADVRDALGVTPEHFSFPFGRASPAAHQAVQRAALRSAAVTEPPALVGPGADRFALPRLSAPPSMTLFPFFTSGAYPDVSRALLGRA